MKKITLMFLLSLCILTLNAQQNIKVSISTKVMNNNVFILTSIISNYNDLVVIPSRLIYGEVGGSSSYIFLNAYDTKDNFIGKSNNMYVPMTIKNSFIVLHKGESYEKLDLLYSTNDDSGYYDIHFGAELSKIQAKVHLVYIIKTPTDVTSHEEDILSNKIMSIH